MKLFQLLCNSIAVLGACLGNVKGLFGRASTTTADSRPGHCSNIMVLLAHLCDMDDDMRLWVLRWLAYPLRNPGAKMSTALIFNSPQGSGMSLFFSQVAAQLYGQNAAQISPNELDSKFNSWVAGTNLVVVDGDYSPKHIERVKALITAPSIPLNIKGQDLLRVVNRLNFVYISSRDDFLPVDASSRRFVVIEVPPTRPRAFYQAVAHEIAAGGFDAFRDYLMHGLDMGGFNESTLPWPATQPERRVA